MHEIKIIFKKKTGIGQWIKPEFESRHRQTSKLQFSDDKLVG